LKLISVLTSAVLATTLATMPATASAQTSRTYSYTVSGVEVSASSTEGVFIGSASGSGAIGTWHANVQHTSPLGRSADITGGSFRMALIPASPAHTVTGRFAGTEGGITRTLSGTGCTRQVYKIEGELDPAAAAENSGTGNFDVYLTHYRKRILAQCITYAATVRGAVSFNLPA
jgi:hypothetical protein